MTSQSPRIYLYKITFEEVPYYYYGVKKEKRFDEEYWGSPVANKWCWELYTPKKQILEVFDYTDEGWLEAKKVETRVIKPFLNIDKWCLNENCGGIVSLEVLRQSGNKCYELGLGCHSLTKEQKSEIGKRTGKISGKKGGNRAYELGVGAHGRTREKMSEDRVGERNSFYGKTHSDETKKLIGQKNSESMKGRLWWNDGQTQKRSKECPSDGWVRGKLKKIS